MFDLRKKIIIGTGIAAGIVLILILSSLFFSRDSKNTEPEQNQDVSDTAPIENTEPVVEKEVILSGQPAPEDSGELFARQSARLFVERFLTYSNQNNDAHIADTLDFASANMQNWMKTQGKETSGEYEGVTTKVIYSNVTSLSNTNAEIAIGIQQIFQTIDGTEYKTRDGRVEMIKSGNNWLVNGLYLE